MQKTGPKTRLTAAVVLEDNSRRDEDNGGKSDFVSERPWFEALSRLVRFRGSARLNDCSANWNLNALGGLIRGEGDRRCGQVG